MATNGRHGLILSVNLQHITDDNKLSYVVVSKQNRFVIAFTLKDTLALRNLLILVEKYKILTESNQDLKYII